MKFDPEKHHRASTRLKGYDYSLAGAYFITIVSYHREMLFGEIVDGEMKLNRRGEIVQEEWFLSAAIRKELRLFADEFVVMPNHVHGIVWIVEHDLIRADGLLDPVRATGPGPSNPVRADGPLDPVRATGRSPLGPKPKSLSSFVAGFKSSVTKRMRDELNETGIWQRNYHDRIIRNDRELNAVRNYIASNPLNWAEDEENILLGE